MEDICRESIKILKNKEEINSFEINARKAAEELSWFNAAKKMSKIYK